MMDRLTNSELAATERDQYERSLSKGYMRNIPHERYLRLAAYEDAGLTPEEINDLASVREISPEAEYAINKHADSIIACLDRLLAQAGSDDRLRELAEADKEGRVVVLPCKVGDTMIDLTFPEGPNLMKNIRLGIFYECGCGIDFHMCYDTFIDLVAHGRIKPESGRSAGEE